MEQISLLHCKPQISHTRKLWPPETKRTVSVTGLSLTWEKQSSFAIFMLHPVQSLSIHNRHIKLLSCGIGIKLHPYVMNTVSKFFCII